MLAERFDAQVVASAGTIEQMHNTVSVRDVFWDKLWPGQIPAAPVTAVTVPDNRFSLEGHELVIVEVGHADSDDNAVLHVPDLGLVVAGDAIYNGVHQSISASRHMEAAMPGAEAVDTSSPCSRIGSSPATETRAATTTPPASSPRPANTSTTPTIFFAKYEAPEEFFFAMLKRRFDRQLGATILWAGTDAIYASRGHEDSDVLAAPSTGGSHRKRSYVIR